MKTRMTLVVLIPTLLFALAGCTASQLAGADRAVGGTPLPALTLPTTQPGVYTTTQPSNGILTIHLIGDAANAAAPIVNTYAPAPIGGIVAGILGVIGAVAGGVVASSNKSKLAQAEAVIAAAAPGVAKLVNQVTDNQTLVSDVTSIAQLTPGVITLLNHPAAISSSGGVSVVKTPVVPAVIVPQ